MTFEYKGGGGWWMNSEEIHPFPKTPLYSVLRWILDQLNTSSFEFIAEEGNDMPVHTIVLGRGRLTPRRQRRSPKKSISALLP